VDTLDHIKINVLMLRQSNKQNIYTEAKEKKMGRKISNLCVRKTSHKKKKSKTNPPRDKQANGWRGGYKANLHRHLDTWERHSSLGRSHTDHMVSHSGSECSDMGRRGGTKVGAI
jgi:hypothetical protein